MNPEIPPGAPVSEPQQLVLIADEGELRDVRDALGALGIAFASAESGDAAAEVPLLVTSAARAWDALDANERNVPPHHFHLVVSDADGEALEDVPCDFLLRPPVSREVLRLLIERARYEGPERRRMTRVALGAPVLLRRGDREQQAILAQISVGGCGLVTGFALEEGETTVIALPPELVGSRRLALSGTVLSSRQVTTADGATFDVSIAFAALDLCDRVTLRALMAGQPIDFRPEPGRHAAGGAPRRGARRRPAAGCGRVARVVIGRDLTESGMRIDLDAGLAAGDALELALYGSGCSEALLLRGRTERDPDEEAWHVHFEDLDECAARDIGKLLSACANHAGFVIAEILER
jgi:hypothetical protein